MDSITSYRVYTREFDKTLASNQLDSALGPLSIEHAAALDAAWQRYQGALVDWRMECDIAALEASRLVRMQTTEQMRNDTVVSILVDHSGSMRGQSILLAAATIDVATDFLVHLGCKVEVLGFTTTSWQGGRSRKHWLSERPRPKTPGRLCDLLHIIYRTADSTLPHAGDLRPMLRPDLLKENVDGEALQWAASRLRDRPEKRKLLLAVSDGAPVDDSTLAENDHYFLARHLTEVIKNIEAEAVIELAAIGIRNDPAHSVTHYYRIAESIDVPQDLGRSTLDLLQRLLLNNGQQKSD
ncbi:cobaltochelatase CobT-related protein [Rhizobium jaguaris]|nr:cobalamin biosynthesis protein CobT [Rhizobium jaguaris]